MRSMIDLCFMCSNENQCNIVDNKIVTQVEYLMPEITIIKLRLPLRYCFICEQKLQLFCTFKKDCVENSLRLEARVKEAQNNTDVTEKCTTSETNINKIDEACNKEEVLDKSDNPDVQYPIEGIFIKEEPLSENLSGRQFDDLPQEILQVASVTQTDTHLHADNSVDLDNESDQNYDDHDDVVSDNNELISDKNILVTGDAGSKVYTCLICKKDFKQLSYLKLRHMKIHMGKKEFQCTECKKWFSRRPVLVAHMKLHTGVKEFQCKECKKWFSQKSNLATHMKQHAGVKDFQCTECKKWFSQKSHLATHMKQHTGLADYQCSECGKWFSHKSHLVTHMKKHAGVKDFQCNECKKWFLQKSTLTRHLKQHCGVVKHVIKHNTGIDEKLQ